MKSATKALILSVAILFCLGGMLVSSGVLRGDWAVTSAPQATDSSGNGAAQKQSIEEESAAAQRGPTATQAFGNPDKWAGTFVRWRCRITNVVSSDGDNSTANAVCGAGIDAHLDITQPNIDYTDQSAVNRSIAESEHKGEEYAQKISDQALFVLVGAPVGDFDGGQKTTIFGPVVGSIEGKNGMGVTVRFATVRVDYAK
jgi:hypothetical protein